MIINLILQKIYWKNSMTFIQNSFLRYKKKPKTLNFFDLKIQKIKYHAIYKFKYDIYRKPTTSKLSINFHSVHPNNHKWANFYFLLYRFNNIPLSKTSYKIEFNNILITANYNNIILMTKLNQN